MNSAMIDANTLQKIQNLQKVLLEGLISDVKNILDKQKITFKIENDLLYFTEFQFDTKDIDAKSLFEILKSSLKSSSYSRGNVDLGIRKGKISICVYFNERTFRIYNEL